MSTLTSTVKKTVKKLIPVEPSDSAKTSDSMLTEFFVDSLKDIYWAEKQLTKALPQMEEAAFSSKLKGAFQEHLQQTQTHISRLEEVFSQLGRTARGKKCPAMEGLVEESESVIDDTESETATRDVALIVAAQKVEHYEIATYGSLVTLAKILGYDGIASILAETLKEEKETDTKLTTIAEQDVNYVAVQEYEN